jgi:hypothetical protein
MTSTTPRTDNAAMHGDGTTVPADFAADLERELAAAKAEVEAVKIENAKAFDTLQHMAYQMMAYQREVERLREVLQEVCDRPMLAEGVDWWIRVRAALKETK